ncbi:putative signal peptide protein [Puccinia sorghi]|uniref:Putative signal peptide protein n=1 Tax=Puccinia sorghi TaxID=27349 RepID=A0A0L6V9W3_9BASI|nr:putative signal peptide protein [Puccinia sorghi]
MSQPALLALYTLPAAAATVELPPVYDLQTPTAEELEVITFYLEHYEYEFAYAFDKTAILLKTPEENCDPGYYCGKPEFYDEKCDAKAGKGVDRTRTTSYTQQACYWNASVRAPKQNDAAEFAMSSAISCCTGLSCCWWWNTRGAYDVHHILHRYQVADNL